MAPPHTDNLTCPSDCMSVCLSVGLHGNRRFGPPKFLGTSTRPVACYVSSPRQRQHGRQGKASRQSCEGSRDQVQYLHTCMQMVHTHDHGVAVCCRQIHGTVHCIEVEDQIKSSGAEKARCHGRAIRYPLQQMIKTTTRKQLPTFPVDEIAIPYPPSSTHGRGQTWVCGSEVTHIPRPRKLIGREVDGWARSRSRAGWDSHGPLHSLLAPLAILEIARPRLNPSASSPCVSG